MEVHVKYVFLFLAVIFFSGFQSRLYHTLIHITASNTVTDVATN